MSPAVERLAELRRHLDHLRELSSRVPDARALEKDLSLHNDVLYSLLTMCQCVIDLAGELSARRGLPFEDYTQAIRNLGSLEQFPGELVTRLEPLAGFRNVLIHEYVKLDLDRAVEALGRLDDVEQLARIVADIVE